MEALQHPLTLAFGLLGNIISFMVFLSPMPTFYTIYKKKTTEGFQALPYVVALLSCMLWIYYALLKQDATFLITINSIGCLIETAYLAVFLFYSPKNARMSTVKLLLLLNVFGYGTMLVLTLFLAKGESRLKAVGWICLVFNLTVFAAPLFILKKVIRTKSVEFMPFTLSFFLTLGAVTWFFYGFLLKDYNIAFPNILGFIFGVAQMVLYVVYKNAKKVELVVEDEPMPIASKVQELSEHIIDVVKIGSMVCPELSSISGPVVLQAPNNLIEIVLDVPNNVVKEVKNIEEDTKQEPDVQG